MLAEKTVTRELLAGNRSNEKKPQLAQKRLHLSIRPTRWWSQSSWDVWSDDQLLTRLDLAPPVFGLRAIQVEDRCFELKRSGWLRERHEMLCCGDVVATANASFMSRKCVVQMDQVELNLRPGLLPNTRYQVERDGRFIAWVKPAGLLSSRAHAEFPSDLPIELTVFVLWLFMNGSVAYQPLV